MKGLLDEKLEQYGAKHINTKHKAVIEFAVVVPRINTDSKYCTATEPKPVSLNSTQWQNVRVPFQCDHKHTQKKQQQQANRQENCASANT